MEVEDGDWRAAVMRMTPKSGSDAEDMCIGEARADTLGDVKGDVRLVDRAWWDLKIWSIFLRRSVDISSRFLGMTSSARQDTKTSLTTPLVPLKTKGMEDIISKEEGIGLDVPKPPSVPLQST